MFNFSGGLRSIKRLFGLAAEPDPAPQHRVFEAWPGFAISAPGDAVLLSDSEGSSDTKKISWASRDAAERSTGDALRHRDKEQTRRKLDGRHQLRKRCREAQPGKPIVFRCKNLKEARHVASNVNSAMWQLYGTGSYSTRTAGTVVTVMRKPAINQEGN